VYPTDLVQLEVREGSAHDKANDAIQSNLKEDASIERPVTVEHES
jgi:hypothetical protein